jgi:hypothetical protein
VRAVGAGDSGSRACPPERRRGDGRGGRVTIKDSIGTIHEFTAWEETLKDFKEGDRIRAQLGK